MHIDGKSYFARKASAAEFIPLTQIKVIMAGYAGARPRHTARPGMVDGSTKTLEWGVDTEPANRTTNGNRRKLLGLGSSDRTPPSPGYMEQNSE